MSSATPDRERKMFQKGWSVQLYQILLKVLVTCIEVYTEFRNMRFIGGLTRLVSNDGYLSQKK